MSYPVGLMTCTRQRCSFTRLKTSSFDTCPVQLIFWGSNYSIQYNVRLTVAHMQSTEAQPTLFWGAMWNRVCSHVGDSDTFTNLYFLEVATPDFRLIDKWPQWHPLLISSVSKRLPCFFLYVLDCMVGAPRAQTIHSEFQWVLDREINSVCEQCECNSLASFSYRCRTA